MRQLDYLLLLLILLASACEPVSKNYRIVGGDVGGEDVCRLKVQMSRLISELAIDSRYEDVSTWDNAADEVKRLREENLSSFRSRLKTIWICLCIVVTLVLCYGMLLYRYNEGKRDIRKYRHRAEALKGQYDCAKHEKTELERALMEQERCETSTNSTVNSRLAMLNGLIASEITGNRSYAAAYGSLVEAIHKNQGEFIESTKQIYYASYPQFRAYLDSADLDEKEKSIVCLYALGLRGKEISQYIRMKGFYNICSSIRKKLGINEHDTNLGPYVRKLVKELS